jgi:hypothetical protein
LVRAAEDPKQCAELQALLGEGADPAGIAAALRGMGTIDEDAVERVAAYYLVRTKGGRVIDPVTHFHLSNGAQVQQINHRADISDRGLRQSGGLMVNYLYDLDEVETNVDAYRISGSVAVSLPVLRLLPRSVLTSRRGRWVRGMSQPVDCR